MRLFLDAHISARRVAVTLRGQGHDVRAADEERGLDGSDDEELLALVAGEGRVLITCDVKDFPVIARRWAEAGRRHAGLAIVVGIDHGAFGVLTEDVGRTLDARPKQDEWTDLTVFVACGDR